MLKYLIIFVDLYLRTLQVATYFTSAVIQQGCLQEDKTKIQLDHLYLGMNGTITRRNH